MAAYIKTVHLLVEADNIIEAVEADDAVNEILREQQRSFAPGSSLLDYAHDLARAPLDVSDQIDVANYSEGDFMPLLNR